MNIASAVVRIRKLAWVVRTPLFWRALYGERVLAAAEHRRILERDFATIVDIGANRGQFALAARRWAPRAHIVAFEPLPEPAETFLRVFAGDTRVQLHVAAIGPTDEKRIMHVSRHDDSSSLLPIGREQVRLFPATEEASTLNVRVGRLESFLSPTDLRGLALLKLDVQGYELQALRGCESLLSYFDVVYCECSFVELYEGQALADDVIEWLRQRGFRFGGSLNPTYDRGLPVQADLYFVRAP